MPVKKASPGAKARGKNTGAAKPVKTANPRRASKCITYNLYDNEDKQNEEPES